MSRYVDGFVLPLRKDQVENYRAIAEQAGKVWKEHGALEYIECVGDDLDIKDVLSFSKLAGANADETVIFAWIVYESREQRDEVNAKVMEDPRMKDACESGNFPFDPKRMAFGGFKTIVEA